MERLESLSEYVRKLSLFVFMAFFISIVGFSVNDSFADHVPNTSEVTVDYDYDNQIVKTTWDFGENSQRAGCYVKTGMVFSLPPDNDGYGFFGDNQFDLRLGGIFAPKMTAEEIIKSQIPCKGSMNFSYNDYAQYSQHDELINLEIYMTFFILIEDEYRDFYDHQYIRWNGKMWPFVDVNEITFIYTPKSETFTLNSCVDDPLIPDDGNIGSPHSELQVFPDKSERRSELSPEICNTDDYTDDNHLKVPLPALSLQPYPQGTLSILIELDPTQIVESEDKKKNNGSDNKHRTKPTFGLSHQTYMPVVECGYSHNGICYDITDNWYTPFDKVEIKTGVPQEIIIKGYFPKGIKTIGWGLVPEVGMYHKAEVKIQVYIDHNDEIEYEKLYTEQKHNILNMTNIVYEYYEEPCGYIESTCDVLKMSNVIFMVEPIFEKIAIYGVDLNGRTQATFLNEGYDIFGESLNEPLLDKVSVGKGGALYPQRAGTVDLTLVEYKTNTWQDEYGYLWQGDNYKSFKIISTIPVPIKAPDKITTIIDRSHSEFYKITEIELKRALEIFDASMLINELPKPIQSNISKIDLELEALKLEYKKQIEAFNAEKYLIDKEIESKITVKRYMSYEELNKKYDDSLSLLLQQIKELENPPLP